MTRGKRQTPVPWSHVESSGVMRSHAESHGVMRSHVESRGLKWSHMESRKNSCLTSEIPYRNLILLLYYLFLSCVLSDGILVALDLETNIHHLSLTRIQHICLLQNMKVSQMVFNLLKKFKVSHKEKRINFFY